MTEIVARNIVNASEGEAKRSGSIEQVRSVCSLGAMGSVLAIPRVMPITHCGPGCGNKQLGALISANGHQGGEVSFPSTNATEHEVVFGGAERLGELIEATLQIVDADLFVVLTGCFSDLVGDDVASVVSGFQERGVPVVYAETGGFRGNNLFGHELVTRAIIDQYVGDYEGPQARSTVNVWSLVPYFHPFWRGDLEEIKRLLEGVGLRVNILFGAECKGIAEWKDIPMAQFNLVLSPWLGLATAKHLQEKYGQPFLHIPVIPIGAKESSSFLREVAAFAGLDREQVEGFIAREEDRYYRYLADFGQFYSSTQHKLPSQFMAVADSSYNLALTKFAFEELGLMPAGQIITDNPPHEYRSLIRTKYNDITDGLGTQVEFEEDGYLIHRKIRETPVGRKAPFLFGTTWEHELAKELNAVLVEVGFPANDTVVLARSYVGYRGALSLVEELYSAAIHPDFVAIKKVRSKNNG